LPLDTGLIVTALLGMWVVRERGRLHSAPYDTSVRYLVSGLRIRCSRS
jgi:hypothetical protein